MSAFSPYFCSLLRFCSDKSKRILRKQRIVPTKKRITPFKFTRITRKRRINENIYNKESKNTHIWVLNPVKEGHNFALAKRGLPLFFVHIAKKERKSTYPNEEQTRHWRLPREGATPVRKKCKITYEENNLFPAVPPRSCALGAVCSLGGTGIPPRCDGERHLSRGDAPSFSTFRLIFSHFGRKFIAFRLPCHNFGHLFAAGRQVLGESSHKRGKCRRECGQPFPHSLTEHPPSARR